MSAMRARISFCALAAFAVTACAGEPDVVAAPAFEPVANWRVLATEDDRARLRNWRDAFTEALAEAREAGHAAEIEREGPLLDPDAALPEPAPPPGEYACRMVKLGSQGERTLDYIEYPPFLCRIGVEDGVGSFVKLTGSQRPIGRLYPEGPRRMVFLGTLQLGDEQLTLQYGRDRGRNMIGALERIGEERWRLVFPYPHFESILDVLELVPAEP